MANETDALRAAADRTPELAVLVVLVVKFIAALIWIVWRNSSAHAKTVDRFLEHTARIDDQRAVEGQAMLAMFRQEMRQERERCDERLDQLQERHDAQHAEVVAGQKEIRQAIRDLHGDLKVRQAVEDRQRGTEPERDP